MPWGILIRLMTRVLAGMFIWRTATGRRTRDATPVRAPQQRTRINATASVQAIREGARLGWHVVAVLTFFAAAVVLITAGVTLTVLSPRWLGITLLALAALAAGCVALELRLLWRLLSERRRRRQQQALRGRVS
jgi:Flp pilus assembly protein TadB